jgi:hypothetical protein
MYLEGRSSRRPARAPASSRLLQSQRVNDPGPSARAPTDIGADQGCLAIAKARGNPSKMSTPMLAPHRSRGFPDSSSGRPRRQCTECRSAPVLNSCKWRGASTEASQLCSAIPMFRVIPGCQHESSACARFPVAAVSSRMTGRSRTTGRLPTQAFRVDVRCVRMTEALPNLVSPAQAGQGAGAQAPVPPINDAPQAEP